MAGKILTPSDAMPPSEMQLMVNVNDQPTPLPVAKLIVLNEVAEQLKRIADILTERRDKEATGPK